MRSTKVAQRADRLHDADECYAPAARSNRRTRHEHSRCYTRSRHAQYAPVSRRPRRQLPAPEVPARGARAVPRRARSRATQLRAVEDEAIRGIVKFQEDLGLRGITDGEFRRTYFHIDFLTQLQGVETKGGIPVKFHSATGEVDFAPPVMQVIGKVRHDKPIQRADFEFLKLGDAGARRR